MQLRLHNLQVMFTYPGHWVKVKVTGAKGHEISFHHAPSVM